MNKHELKTNEVAAATKATPLVEQIALEAAEKFVEELHPRHADRKTFIGVSRMQDRFQAAIDKATEAKDSEIEMLHRQRQAAERQRDSVIRQSAAQPQRSKKNLRLLANLLVCTSTERPFVQLQGYEAKVDKFERIIREWLPASGAASGDMELADKVTSVGKDTPSTFELLRPETIQPPKEERGEPQEWTDGDIEILVDDLITDAGITSHTRVQSAKQCIRSRLRTWFEWHTAALAAERERVRVQLVKEVDQDYFDTKQQLLQALAAIEYKDETLDWLDKLGGLGFDKHEIIRRALAKTADLTALREHDAEEFRKGWESGHAAGVEVLKPFATASPSDGGQVKETFKPQSSTAATGKEEKGDNGHIS